YIPSAISLHDALPILWPGSYLPQLAQAWEQSLAHVPDSVTSTLALLQLPPDGPFPPELLGTTVVHLSYATPEGAAALSPMRGVRSEEHTSELQSRLDL